MYLEYWGLKQPPFRAALDVRSFYESPTHEEALARLHFLVEGRRRVGLLLGPGGSGKSAVLEVLASRLALDGTPVARLSLLGLGEEEFVAGLATDWGLDPAPRSSLGDLWRQVQDRLIEFRLQSTRCVALVDDADEANRGVLQQVARLAQIEAACDPTVTVLVAARNEGSGRLGTRLLELADLRIDVTAWDVAETCRYLAAALARCGGSETIFEAEAMVELAELAGGIPRSVAQLADLTLLAAAADHLPAVDAATVRRVYRELGAIEPAAPAASRAGTHVRA